MKDKIGENLSETERFLNCANNNRILRTNKIHDLFSSLHGIHERELTLSPFFIYVCVHLFPILTSFKTCHTFFL